MAIYKLIANGSFGPDEIEVMKTAYEAALVDVGVSDRNDPITELIAKTIINVTATGERDPGQVMERALNALGLRRSFGTGPQISVPDSSEHYDLPRPSRGQVAR